MPATAAFSYGQRGERADLSELLRALLLFTGGHLLVRLCRTRSIGRPPDVENWTKTVLQASLTSVFVQFSPPREL